MLASTSLRVSERERPPMPQKESLLHKGLGPPSMKRWRRRDTVEHGGPPSHTSMRPCSVRERSIIKVSTLARSHLKSVERSKENIRTASPAALQNVWRWSWMSPARRSPAKAMHTAKTLEGRWKRADHITIAEARAMFKLCQVMSVCPNCRNLKMIALEDNLAVSGSHSKGRSTSWPLNYIHRRKSALLIAMASRLLLPWIETTKQVVDYLNRSIDESV